MNIYLPKLTQIHHHPASHPPKPQDTKTTQHHHRQGYRPRDKDKNKQTPGTKQAEKVRDLSSLHEL
ncbi:hypothetical protein BDR22DRAFT_847298 [Usnea florida]